MISFARRAARPSTGMVRLLVLPFLAGVAGLLLTLKVPSGGAPVVNLLFQWAMYGGWGWWTLVTARALGVPCGDVLAPPADARSWRLLWVALPLLALSVAGFIVQSALLLSLFPAARAAFAATTPDAPQPLVWSVLMMVTGATLVPLVEELVFRGVLLRLWEARFGAHRAALGTTLLFGVLHHDVIGAVAFGIAMVMLLRRSGTLLLPVVVHMAYNAVTGVVTLLPGGDSFTAAELRNAVVPASLVIGASVLCLALAFRPPSRHPAPAAQLA